ncbi:MAG: outer membrane lipoprotein chaperone LolA [Candidatus Methylopumilus sp.]|jgi:outer membrane lipoprotein carrier protein
MKILLSLALLIPLTANAGGVDRLKEFFKNINSMRAGFHQTVADSKGRKLQEVGGTMQLQRPGRFRWDYNKPYVQQIVGDGEKIWLYDPELNQVTVRELTKALGSSPAALLAGNNEMDKHFVLKDTSRKGDLEWVLATSKDKDGEFERVFFGFKGDSLQEMELHDSFGNRTNIVFSDVERNPSLTTKSFLFKTPTGADVVGE